MRFTTACIKFDDAAHDNQLLVPRSLRAQDFSIDACPSRKRLSGHCFAAIHTGSGRSHEGGWGREERIKNLFHNISEGRRQVSEADVLKYAVDRGLPTDYVRPFFSGLIKNGGPLAAIAGRVNFEAFRNYVMARESALKRTFDALDNDGDGKISSTDMRAGLSHLAITCPNSRCCYRSRTSCVNYLLGTLGSKNKEPVDFSTFRRFFLLLPQQDMLVEYWLKAGDPACCDIGNHVSFTDERRKPAASPWGHLLAGAAAGAVSRTATAPLETLRLMAMTGALGGSGHAQQARAGGMLLAASELVRVAGWRSLYRGNLANVVRSAPQKALDFFAFDALKGALSRRAGPASSRPPLGTLETLVAAGAAGALSNAALYPLEVVRCRLATDATGVYRGMLQTFMMIARTEGPSAFYRGLVPSVAAILPEAAITYGLFDLLKRSYVNFSGQTEAGVLPSLMAGVFSAFMGQVVAYPLETVSRRMQVTKGTTGTLQAMRDILGNGGVRGLYRGLGAASVRVIPMAVVSFGTYEFIRMQYTKWEEWLEIQAATHEAHLLMQSEQLQCGV